MSWFKQFVVAVLLFTSFKTFASGVVSSLSTNRILNSDISFLSVSIKSQLALAAAYELQFKKRLKRDDFTILLAIQVSSLYLNENSRTTSAEITKALKKHGLRLGMVEAEIDYFKKHGESSAFFPQSRIEYLPLENEDLIELNNSGVTTVAQFFSRTVQEFLLHPLESYGSNFDAIKQKFGDIFEFYRLTLYDDVIQRAFRKHILLAPELPLKKVRMNAELRRGLKKLGIVSVGQISALSDERAVELISTQPLSNESEIQFYELRENLILLVKSSCEKALTL